MKKLIIFAVMALAVASVSAQKKVAVWETKCSDGTVTQFQSTMVRGAMETAAANAKDYTGYDRTAFDAIIKEQEFQRSGAVSNSDIKRLGEMAGVQYIIVPEATVNGKEMYIVVKMLDVETGEFGSAYDVLCTTASADIKKACAQLGTRLFSGAGGASGSAGGGASLTGQDYTEMTFGINMRMVYVEGGSFTMGGTSDQGSDCEEDEFPTRSVTVSPFYICRIEITQSQWENVMGTNIQQQATKAGTSFTRGTGADYPMYYVSWEEAKEFCERLSRQSGLNYTLPTEAEWEYAARGGNKSEGTRFSGGWSISDVAWYHDNSNNSTHRCGTKRANALGLHDMTGNVEEWCEDWYGPYQSAETVNPKGEPSGTKHVVRGGAWNSYQKDCRITNRASYDAGHRFNNRGFRVVVH